MSQECHFEICYSFLHSDIFVGLRILGGGGLVVVIKTGQRDKTRGRKGVVSGLF